MSISTVIAPNRCPSPSSHHADTRKAQLPSLEAINDFDEVFFNGVSIGKTGKENAIWWSAKRRYTAPKALVKPGRNVIAVRVWDQFGGGGFTGEAAEPMIFAK